MNAEIRDLIRTKKKIWYNRRKIGFNVKDYRQKCRALKKAIKK